MDSPMDFKATKAFRYRRRRRMLFQVFGIHFLAISAFLGVTFFLPLVVCSVVIGGERGSEAVQVLAMTFVAVSVLLALAQTLSLAAPRPHCLSRRGRRASIELYCLIVKRMFSTVWICILLGLVIAMAVAVGLVIRLANSTHVG